MELIEIADELYSLPLAEFIAARDRRAREARAAGEAGIAREVARLRKPSTAAWIVNMLQRRHPEELAQLSLLGNALSVAQTQRAGQVTVEEEPKPALPSP